MIATIFFVTQKNILTATIVYMQQRNTIYTPKTLAAHLAREHKISPISQYLREIVYGGTDGIVTTFAVVAGFNGAGAQSLVTQGFAYLPVLLFGFANLFADSTSMALGNFLSIRSNQDVYRENKRKEQYEIENSPEMEKEETITILKSRGYSEKDARDMTRLYMKNKDYWLEFMMRDELAIPNPEGEKPLSTALATFVSFILFGITPLAPYVIFQSASVPFLYSAIAAFFSLSILGFLRWQVTKEAAIRSVGEVILLGGVSASIAYFVGTFFRA